MVEVGRTVTVRELRNSTAEVVRQLEDGVEVTLTSRGNPVARLIPLHSPSPGQTLLDAVDQLGIHHTSWADDIERAREEESERDVDRW